MKIGTKIFILPALLMSPLTAICGEVGTGGDFDGPVVPLPQPSPETDDVTCQVIRDQLQQWIDAINAGTLR